MLKRLKKSVNLSDEQLLFVNRAKERKNIIVDACIGSGKTTAIQCLCGELPSELNILYLTYNKLLKIDAKAKIKNKNAFVTNYHGFAFTALKRAGISTGVSDLIQSFNKVKPAVDRYDVLIIDEYQDIDAELAAMLEIIKSINPAMQIIAVGDIEQKIYDKTTLNARAFIEQFLGEHIKLEFTRCFRLSAPLAARLGRIWEKEIIGVNHNCTVEEMNIDSVTDFLGAQAPRDILCLGSRTGEMTAVLNQLEERFPDKFNKNTVYASISDTDAGATQPERDSAIFTTFDSSKGLERKICVIFDYTESYWQVRIEKPQQSYEILRNIFCVAASRGKERIIFVNSGEALLSDRTISTRTQTAENFTDVDVSAMFDFKYKEDVEECFSLLKVTKLSNPESPINIANSDGLIDLSPCIGIYQEALYFDGYDIDKSIELWLELNADRKFLYTEKDKGLPLDNKILTLVSLETKQNRYRTQVKTPFINESERKRIVERLGTLLSRSEDVQVPCEIKFTDKQGKRLFSAKGFADAVRDGVVYELKFVSELTHEHFLQCASYVAALGLPKGVLWNVRNNARYEISISDKKKFLDAVAKTVTKNYLHEYSAPERNAATERTKYFAVLDTETNWNNEVMSIGVAIANADTFALVDAKYYIITPEYMTGGMYSSALRIIKKDRTKQCDRAQAVRDLLKCFAEYGITKIFAYNAAFDYRILPELHNFVWYDIMRLAAYRQYNPKIREEDCFRTGRLRRNYGVESMARLLNDSFSYCEKHNALTDAMDELLYIMKPLGYSADEYLPLGSRTDG